VRIQPALWTQDGKIPLTAHQHLSRALRKSARQAFKEDYIVAGGMLRMLPE
jgi:hypothetical protein